jgi:hypothetical protein
VPAKEAAMNGMKKRDDVEEIDHPITIQDLIKAREQTDLDEHCYRNHRLCC